MTSRPWKTDERLQPLVAQCAIELFAHYGVTLTEAPLSVQDLEIAGLIGFTGTLRGTLFVASTESFLSACCPPPPTDVADWTGELANQLLGRFKNHLVRRGIAT